MKIVKTSSEFDMAQMWKMTLSNGTKKMKELRGKKINVCEYAIYDSDDSEESENMILSIDTGDGVYATNSATFIRTFNEILDLRSQYQMELKNFDINVKTGIGKSGNEYIYADI